MRKIFAIIFLYSLPAFSYQSSLTSSMNEVKWSTQTVPLRIINNSSSLTDSQSLIEAAIREWNNSSNFTIQKVSSSNNQIYFSHNFSIYGPAVIGITEVSHGSNGEISSARIILNDENFDFTNNPVSVIGSHQVYLKDVVTHELGHFIGLTHSEVLNSTMFYSNFPGQSSLAADDKAGIRNKYDTGTGKIYGYLKGGNHVGVLGGHLQAISRKTGEAIGAISGEDGYFEIAGLDLNDTYYLYSSPLKNVNSLPEHLANVQKEFCPAAYVGSFFSPCGRENDGLPSSINLTSYNTEVDLGEISINCSLRTQEEYTYQKIQSSFSEINIFNYEEEQKHEKSFVGFFLKSQISLTSWTVADKFEVNLEGLPSPEQKKIKFSLRSQFIGNPIEYRMIIRRGLSTIYQSPIYLPQTSEGTFTLDQKSEDNLSSGSLQYHIEIQARKLNSVYAAYSIPDLLNFGSDQHMPYLFFISIENDSGMIVDSLSDLSDNSSCLDAPFTYSVNKSAAASGQAIRGTREDQLSPVAGCGTIEPPQGPGPGSNLFVLGFGFILSGIFSLMQKRNKNTLS